MKFYDIIVVIPLEQEMGEFFGAFRTQENRTTGRNIIYEVEPENGISILAVMQEGMGRDEAAKACNAIFASSSCSLLVSLGIAGGLSKDLRLADVCHSGTIIDIYNNAKASDNAEGILLEFVPQYYSTRREISSPLAYMRVMPELKPEYDDWQARQGAFANSVLPNPVPGRFGEDEAIGSPKSLPGPIVCGQVSQSENYNKLLKEGNRSVMALDTESGAIFDFAQDRGIDALTIRGISDYANRNKGKLEGYSKECVRTIAARNAATFLKMQCHNPFFQNMLIALREKRQPDLHLVRAEVPKSYLPAALDILTSTVDKKLRLLSPQYRSKPTGYLLPVPRIRSQGMATPSARVPMNPPMEIRDTLAIHSRFLVRVPRAYPDRSLAWILANDLLVHESQGRQIVPIVLDGGRIRRPVEGPNALAAVDLGALRPEEARIVFIIDEVPLTSNTGTDLLAEWVQAHPDAAFIFFASDDQKLMSRAEFARRVGAETYNLCEISFWEMATWVQSQFEIPGREAEVIAIRLRELFKRFRLPAHPTFFAGIPEEVFNALLNANRRAELIQLAVDGFLSFIVASDNQPVRLSRTTRSRFLRQFAYKSRVEKRTYTADELCQLAADFMEQYDLPIDASEFVNGFVTNGIINFRNEHAEISLTFIESYLLALELGDNPTEAARYFDPDDPDFDILAFDMYAEISPHEGVVSQVRTALQSVVSEMAADGEQTVVISGEANPRVLRNTQRIALFEGKIRSAAEAVNRGVSDKDEKQRLLDVADHIQEKMAEESDREGASTDVDVDMTNLGRQIQIWFISTVLLGQAVESLTTDVKNDLIRGLLVTGEGIIERWTSLHWEIDFDELKGKLRNDEKIKDYFSREGMSEDEVLGLVAGFMDLFEVAMLIDPTRKIFYHLCEQARHAALVPALERPKGLGKLAEVLRTSWLSDIDIGRGKRPLERAISKLPPAPLLRFALATHYFTRVFWSLSDKATRLALLDVSNQLLKPMNKQIPKGEFKRLIEAASPKDEEE